MAEITALGEKGFGGINNPILSLSTRHRKIPNTRQIRWRWHSFGKRESWRGSNRRVTDGVPERELLSYSLPNPGQAAQKRVWPTEHSDKWDSLWAGKESCPQFLWGPGRASHVFKCPHTTACGDNSTMGQQLPCLLGPKGAEGTHLCSCGLWEDIRLARTLQWRQTEPLVMEGYFWKHF